jgi:hypothetical protein
MYTLDRTLGGPWASLGAVAPTKSLLRRELPVQTAAGPFKNADFLTPIFVNDIYYEFLNLWLQIRTGTECDCCLLLPPAATRSDLQDY